VNPSTLAILSALEHADRWSTATEVAREANRAASTCRRVLRSLTVHGADHANGAPVRSKQDGQATRYLLADESRGWLEGQQHLAAARALLRDRSPDDTAPRSRMRKLVCGCGRILRASLTTAEEGGILCGLCGMPFRLDDLTHLVPADAVTDTDLPF